MNDEAIKRMIDCLTMLEDDEECPLSSAEIRFLKAASRVVAQLMPSGPRGPFICGIGGEEGADGLPERIHVCPLYGLDGFAVYKKERDYDAPGW